MLQNHGQLKQQIRVEMMLSERIYSSRMLRTLRSEKRTNGSILNKLGFIKRIFSMHCSWILHMLCKRIDDLEKSFSKEKLKNKDLVGKTTNVFHRTPSSGRIGNKQNAGP